MKKNNNISAIAEILTKNAESDGFTTPLKGNISRYIIALTDNINPSLELLNEQFNSFSQLDNINIGGWINKQDNIKYIDISTSTNDLQIALAMAKLFVQKAIFDIKELEEIIIK